MPATPQSQREKRIALRSTKRAIEYAISVMTALGALGFLLVPSMPQSRPAPLFLFMDRFMPSQVVALLLAVASVSHLWGLLVTHRCPPIDCSDAKRPSRAEQQGAITRVVANYAQGVIWAYLAMVYGVLLAEGQSFFGSFLVLGPLSGVLFTSKATLREAREWQRATTRRSNENQSRAFQEKSLNTLRGRIPFW